jgi:hypothetical protein
MAKIKYDQNGDPYLSGTLGKSLTFLLWRGVRVVKSKALRRGPMHGAQIRLGRVSREAAGVWSHLTLRERERYGRTARKDGQQSGYQAFVKEWWRKAKVEGKN